LGGATALVLLGGGEVVGGVLLVAGGVATPEGTALVTAGAVLVAGIAFVLTDPGFTAGKLLVESVAVVGVAGLSS